MLEYAGAQIELAWHNLLCFSYAVNDYLKAQSET